MNSPQYLHFQLTERCNLSCPGCYLPERSGKGATADEIEKNVFKPLALAGVRFATLTGGEPLLHPQCINICAAAVRCFESVQLVCNGTLLNIDMYESLCNVGVKAIKVSLDAPVSAVHDALRGKAGCFKIVTDNLRSIVALPLSRRGGIDLGCICTVYPENVHLLRETAALVEGMGLDSILFQPFHPYGMLYPDTAAPFDRPTYDKKFLAVLEKQLMMLRELRINMPVFVDNSLEMLDKFQEFYTSPDGPVQVCGTDRFVFVNSLFQVRGCLFCEPLGSLQEETLTQFRQSQVWRSFDSFRLSCRRCLMGCQFVNKNMDKANKLTEEGFSLLNADHPDLNAARIAFDKSLSYEYSVAAAHGAGLVRSRLGELKEGRLLLEEALSHQPRNCFILADLGWILLQNAEHPDLNTARIAFDKSLSYEFSVPAAHGAGLVRSRLGELKEGRLFLEKALSHLPRNCFILSDLGWILLQQDAWEDMESVAKRLESIQGGECMAYRLKGLAARKRGELNNAMQWLRMAMEANPDSKEPWPPFEYGLACLEANCLKDAKYFIRIAVERMPLFPWFHYRLAQTLHGLGRSDRGNRILSGSHPP